MKKTPLRRRTGITRVTPLSPCETLARTRRPLAYALPLRKVPLRPRSKKRAELYRTQRAPLVARLLAERPWCEIRWDDGCEGRAVDVDEIQSRAAGGSITDETNLQTACRHCHDAKHGNPTEAKQRGLTRPSWHRKETR